MQHGIVSPLAVLDTVSFRLSGADWRALDRLDGDCERVLGIGRDELLAGGFDLWRKRISRGSRRRNQHDLRRAFRRREAYTLAYRVREPSGRRRWLAETGRGCYGDDGRLVAVEGLLVDLGDLAQLVGQNQQVSANLAALLAVTDELAGIDSLDLLTRRAVELARERLGVERCGLFLLQPGDDQFRGTYGTSLQGETTDEHDNLVDAEDVFRLIDEARERTDRLWHMQMELPFEWDGSYGVQIDGPPAWVARTPLQTGRRLIGFMANDCAISRGPCDESRQDLLAVYCALVAGLIERQMAADALRQQQAESRDLVTNSTNALALVRLLPDGDGQVIMANPRFEAIAGRSGLAGARLSAALDPTDWPLAERFAPVVRDGEPRHCTLEPRGKGRTFAVTAFRPRAGCFAVSVRDITAERRHEQAEQLNQARLDALLRLSEMTDADDRALCLFALERGVALTGSAFGYLAFASDDETELTLQAWSAGGRAEYGDAHLGEPCPLDAAGWWGEPARSRRVVIANHGQAPIDRYMAVPVFDGERLAAVCGVANKAGEYDEGDAGQLRLLMAGMWRVLQRRRADEALRAAEMELRRSEERYRLLFDNTPVGIIQYDTEGVIERANDAFAALIGTDAEDLRGVSLLSHEEPVVREAIARVLAGEHVAHEGSLRSTLRDGTLVLRTLSHPLRHEDGSLQGGVTIAEDIAERQLLEERLRQASKMEAVGRLAGGVAHDFNNLLTTILGYTELALSALAAGDPLRSDLEAISRAAERANGLTRQLLTFSRRQVLSLQVVDLNELVASMMAMLRPLLGEDIALRLELAPDLATTRVDAGQLEQVLMNLCVNARDAMPEGGELAIATHNQAQPGGGDEATGEFVVLSVSDTGVGMDPATQALIFEPFYSTKGKAKGTGLGLATSYGIVAQSQGWISVESAVGQGSTFRVYLPACADLPEPLTLEPEAAAGAPGPASRGLILLVEDQAEVRGLSRRVLRAQGYRVVEAEDGIDALAAFEQLDAPPDLLLTDVVMPRLGGPDLASRLRERCPDLPVLFVSGYTDTPLARLGTTAPNTAFLPKPYSPAALASQVRALLDGHAPPA